VLPNVLSSVSDAVYRDFPPNDGLNRCGNAKGGSVRPTVQNSHGKFSVGQIIGNDFSGPVESAKTADLPADFGFRPISGQSFAATAVKKPPPPVDSSSTINSSWHTILFSRRAIDACHEVLLQAPG